MVSVADFSVIVPAHNEAVNLQRLLPHLRACLDSIRYEVIVVDNASLDSTQEVLMEHRCLARQLKIVTEPTLGYGRAVLAGLKIAEGEVIGIIRADNQERPEDLYKLYLHLKTSNLDLCKAVRRNRLADGLRRVLVSRTYNFLFRMMFGTNVKDINATPKLFTAAFHKRAALESTDWFIDAEIVIKAAKLGYRIGELEIEYFPRLTGRSTVRLKHLWEFLRNMVLWYFRIRRGRLLAR